MKQTCRFNRIHRATLGLLLLLGLPACALARGADPNVERVRRDPGYYREDKKAKELSGLEVQIQGLHEEFRQAMESQDSRLQHIEEDLKLLRGEELRPAMERQDSRLQQIEEEIKLLRGKELGQAMERQDGRLQHIEEELKLLHSKDAAVSRQPPPASPPQQSRANEPAVVMPSSIPKPPTKLTVCSQGCDFQDLQKAVNAAPAGGTVTLAAEINGTCAVISKPLRIEGLRGSDGKRAHLVGGVCNGKAPLVTAGPDIVIEGLEISGIQIGDGNGACVRMDTGTHNLVIRNIHCHDIQMGILGYSKGQLLIEDSVFEKTVGGSAYSHALYLTGGDEAIVRRCKILSASNAGHSLKSGFQKLTVEDSVIAALNAHNSRAIDAFSGGGIVLRRNVIQQGPESDNSDVIGLALESNRLLPSGHSFLMEDNWVVFDNSTRFHKVLIRGQELGPIVVRNNVFVSLNGLGVDATKDDGNRWVDTREQAGLPKFDGTLDSLPKPGKPSASKGDVKK